MNGFVVGAVVVAKRSAGVVDTLVLGSTVEEWEQLVQQFSLAVSCSVGEQVPGSVEEQMPGAVLLI